MPQRRRALVAAVRRGLPLRAAARRFPMGYATAWMWVRRARGKRLDRLDFADRPAGCRRPRNRVSLHAERLIVRLRHQLKDHSALGEHGAAAIRRALVQAKLTPLPSLRTIGRVLCRTGQLDGRRRVRRPPPPPGWHLPRVAQSLAELDSFDAVEGLKIKGGPIVETLNGISLRGKLFDSWPVEVVTAKFVVSCLVSRWKQFGLPAYAQFDNGSVFWGGHKWPDSLGRVTRLCLSLGVIPVFAPPREHGLQNQAESSNNLWERLVWRRFEHRSLKDLKIRSDAYVLARRARLAPAADTVPRRPFPKGWVFDLNAPLAGRVILIRRTSEAGSITLFKRQFLVDRDWPFRLVRAELDLDTDMIHVFRLRKREPDDQPLLRSIPYKLPRRKFHS